MALSLRLTILTPTRSLLDEPLVFNVRLRLADENWLSIYPRHLPLVAETVAGPVQYTAPAGRQTIVLAAGIVQVVENQVTVFTSDLTQAEAPEPGVRDEAIASFDRLARELFMTLQAHPDLGDKG